MILDILKYPDKRLREKCTLVEEFGPNFQAQVNNMFETMYAAPGVGLAAIQVAIFKRFLVMDVGINEGQVIRRHPLVLVNPKIISQEGEIVWEEGCLSCPDLIVSMARSKKIEVLYQDRFGKEETLVAEDLMSVCVQHEIDHLDGILILDKISRLKLDLYKQKLKSDSEKVVVR
jgi:peptide deformylase